MSARVLNTRRFVVSLKENHIRWRWKTWNIYDSCWYIDLNLWFVMSREVKSDRLDKSYKVTQFLLRHFLVAMEFYKMCDTVVQWSHLLLYKKFKGESWSDGSFLCSVSGSIGVCMGSLGKPESQNRLSVLMSMPVCVPVLLCAELMMTWLRWNPTFTLR